MAFILAVGGADHQQITHGQHLAVGGFMRKDTQAAAHVQLPDDVGRGVVLEDLFPIRAIVLAIAETLGVEATELALGGDIVEPVPFHIRRTGRRRQQELPQTSLYSRGHVPWQDVAPRVERGLREFLLPSTTSAPYVEGNRLYYVTAECQLRCLDTQGFRDGENNGPYREEVFQGQRRGRHRLGTGHVRPPGCLSA